MAFVIAAHYGSFDSDDFKYAHTGYLPQLLQTQTQTTEDTHQAMVGAMRKELLIQELQAEFNRIRVKSRRRGLSTMYQKVWTHRQAANRQLSPCGPEALKAMHWRKFVALCY